MARFYKKFGIKKSELYITKAIENSMKSVNEGSIGKKIIDKSKTIILNLEKVLAHTENMAN